MYTVKHHQSIRDTLSSCGLSYLEACGLHAHMVKLEKHNGIHFVVQDLKARFRALLDPSADNFIQHRDGTWRGPWRPLKRLSLRGRKGFRRALRITKIHGLFRALSPKYQDYKVHGEDISSNPERKFSPEEFGVLINTILYQLTEHHVRKACDALTLENSTAYPLRTNGVPLSRGYSLAEVLMTPLDHIRCLDNCPRLVILHYEYIHRVVGETLPNKTHYEQLVHHTKHDVVGSMILLTKDRGLKMRAVVNSFRIIQTACVSLEATLYSYLRKYDTVWIFDQTGGADWVHRQLAEGKSLSSIDLKAASDNIPLTPQLALAQALFPELSETLSFFGDVNRSYWWTPHPGLDLKYSRGHGMGVRGSFPLFTMFLFHACMLIARGEQAFAIVGDDMVVETALEGPLMETLDSWGIPVNYDKSLFSSNIAEFVGRIIDKRGSLGVYKASPLDIDKDPLGLVRQYGARAFRKSSLRNFVRDGTVRKLKVFLKLRSDRTREQVSVGLEDPQERAFLAGANSQQYNRGGVPFALMKWYFSNLKRTSKLDFLGNAIRAQRLYLSKNEDYRFRAEILKDELTKDLTNLRSIEQYTSKSLFRYDVRSWSIPHNEWWKLDVMASVGGNADYTSELTTAKAEAQEREIAEFLSLSPDAHAVDSSYQTAVEEEQAGIFLDIPPGFIGRPHRTPEYAPKTSRTYVMKLVRLFRKAFRRVGSAIRQNRR